MTIFEILVKYHPAFLKGLIVTLKLCIIVWTSGLFLGTIVGILGARWKLVVGIPSQVFSFLMSGIPILVLLFWLHYPFQSILEVVIDPFFTAAICLAIVNTIAVADAVRNVLSVFPKQYITAGKVCGLPNHEIILHIQMPIVLRQLVPVVLMIQVNMLQATLFASLISVDELLRVAMRINSLIYRPVEIYTALALFFLAICLPLNGLALWLKKQTRDYSTN
jgi:polar amino acid transport system permease protein